MNQPYSPLPWHVVEIWRNDCNKAVKTIRPKWIRPAVPADSFVKGSA